MSVQNPDEGTTQASGGAEKPTSTLSDANSQPLPEYVKKLESQIADLTAQVKGVQGSTDKQVSGLVRGEIKRILELKEQGLSEDQIKRELWIDQQINQGQNTSVVPPQGNAGTQPVIDVEGTLKALQFAENDVALNALKLAYAEEPATLVKKAAELRLNQLQTNPRPGNNLPLPGGGSGTLEKSPAQLKADYEKERDTLMTNTRPGDGRVRAFTNLKAKYREAGLDIN